MFYRCENDAKNCISHMFALSDKTQNDNTKRLLTRFKDIEKWKNTIERAIQAQIDEIIALKEDQQKLKQALTTLKMPESIGMKYNID